jgi:hypothetical protein
MLRGEAGNRNFIESYNGQVKIFPLLKQYHIKNNLT